MAPLVDKRAILLPLCILCAVSVVCRLYERFFIKLHPKNSWKCERVLDGIADGPEDFALSIRHQILFVSSHNRRAMSSIGTVLAVDAGSGYAVDISLPNIPKNFRPHGMSIAEDEDRCTLFVISHRWEWDAMHAVEVFQYDSGARSLLHTRTLRSPLLSSPNDLVALNFNELLISNDHCASSFVTQLWHDIAGYACADTVHLRDGEWVSLQDSVSFGNGLVAGAVGDQEYLMRSAAASYTIHNSSIIRSDDQRKINIRMNYAEILPISPDNIELDRISRGLLIAGHPSVTRFLLNAIFLVPAPSAVLIYHGKGDYEVLYYSDGSEISASSVAVRTNESTYFLGQVFDSFILRCTT